MIAHAPVTPMVIPFFHTGMANVVPINPFTRKIMRTMPMIGETVTARAGAAIAFDDLLEEYEKLHGPLRKLALPAPGNGDGGRQGGGGGGGSSAAVTVLPNGPDGDAVWRSSREERQLYSRIARRVEEALLELEAGAKRDLGQDYPGWPPGPAAMRRLRKEEGG